jgi:hypothetical protein
MAWHGICMKLGDWIAFARVCLAGILKGVWSIKCMVLAFRGVSWHGLTWLLLKVDGGCLIFCQGIKPGFCIIQGKLSE